MQVFDTVTRQAQPLVEPKTQPARGPVPLDPKLLQQVSGGGPKGGWDALQAPKGGW